MSNDVHIIQWERDDLARCGDVDQTVRFFHKYQISLSISLSLQDDWFFNMECINVIFLLLLTYFFFGFVENLYDTKTTKGVTLTLSLSLKISKKNRTSLSHTGTIFIPWTLLRVQRPLQENPCLQRVTYSSTSRITDPRFRNRNLRRRHHQRLHHLNNNKKHKHQQHLSLIHISEPTRPY